jgi:hypothetical protein
VEVPGSAVLVERSVSAVVVVEPPPVLEPEVASPEPSSPQAVPSTAHAMIIVREGRVMAGRYATRGPLGNAGLRRAMPLPRRRAAGREPSM